MYSVDPEQPLYLNIRYFLQQVNLKWSLKRRLCIRLVMLIIHLCIAAVSRSGIYVHAVTGWSRPVTSVENVTAAVAVYAEGQDPSCGAATERTG